MSKVFIWRIPIALTDLAEEYHVEFSSETLKTLVDSVPKDSLDTLYNKCEELRQKLNIQDKQFSIKLFLAVMFNVLRLYWVTKTQ